MERKLLGSLLLVLGIAGLIMADVSFMKTIAGNNHGGANYTGQQPSYVMGILGYGAAGLIFIFLGINMFRKRNII